MQIQFKKTIISSQLNSKRQKGAPLSAPNSAYTKVDTFLLHKLVQRITGEPLHRERSGLTTTCGCLFGFVHKKKPAHLERFIREESSQRAPPCFVDGGSIN